jgi:transcriptional regulator of arginine metabolism
VCRDSATNATPLPRGPALSRSIRTVPAKEIYKSVDSLDAQLYKNTVGCIFVFGEALSAGKTFRHGQILRLVSDGSIVNQEELRRRLAAQRLRVTQATLSRDIQELRLIKTQRGYKSASALPDNQSPLPPLARALGEFLLDIRPAENLLVLKTPPSGAQPLAAAVDGSKFPEIAGTIAGDDTVLIITPNKKSRESLQRRIEALLK